MTRYLFVASLATLVSITALQAQSSAAEIDRRTAQVQSKVVSWRRDIHEHPELGNREFRTAKLVAEHLRALGMEVRTEVGHTGVIGVLKGGKPGRVVALRADMDALPVAEQVDLPFKSTVRTQFNGQDVGVMHACGHDTHVAMLMGVAEVLAGMKQQIPGTVKFIFQPAEEGPPQGEEGGAQLMLKEGAFQNPKPNAVFGIHVFAGIPAGTLQYRPHGALASADALRIIVRGKQTHGAKPWEGLDPVVVASQIVVGLQTIVSRQLNITVAPAIVTVAMIHGGVRNNIIPDSVVMEGTLRALDADMRTQLHQRVRQTAEHIAQAGGATAVVEITDGYPVTVNDPQLTQWAVPTLERVAPGKTRVGNVQLGAEDFSFFAQQAPGLFLILGGTPADQDMSKAASNHSGSFYVDESTMPLGVRALASLAVDYLNQR